MPGWNNLNEMLYPDVASKARTGDSDMSKWIKQAEYTSDGGRDGTRWFSIASYLVPEDERHETEGRSMAAKCQYHTKFSIMQRDPCSTAAKYMQQATVGEIESVCLELYNAGMIEDEHVSYIETSDVHQAACICRHFDLIIDRVPVAEQGHVEWVYADTPVALRQELNYLELDKLISILADPHEGRARQTNVWLEREWRRAIVRWTQASRKATK